MSKEVVWTNFGLDGIGSYLVLRWLRGKDIEVHYTTPKRFRDDFLHWQINSGINTYSKIFIVNLDLTKSIDVADLPNCVIVDNHVTHIERKDLYNAARTAVVEATSTTRLLFRIFRSELVKKLAPAQIKLIALVDDYISGVNKMPASKLLNALYWGISGDKMQRFVQDFDVGFQSFTPLHKNIIAVYFKRYHQLINELDIFEGRLPFQHKTYKIFSTFADSSLDEISQHIMQKHQADVVAMVNLKTKSVFFRKSANCPIPLPKLAERLCDGGGSDFFAGGDLTDKFLNFCKTLQQVC